MKNTLFLAAALSLGLTGMAAAQTAPTGGPTAKGNAPLKHAHTVNDGAAKSGHNSFTEGQARQHILNSGYTGVAGLAKGSDGVWRGRASKGGGAPVDVAMDFKGNVTQGAGGMHRGPMAGSSHGAASPSHVAMGQGAGAAAAGATTHDGRAVHGGSGVHSRGGHHHLRHHSRHSMRHHHHHHGGSVGMSGVDRNDNGISDKEDRARRH